MMDDRELEQHEGKSDIALYATKNKTSGYEMDEYESFWEEVADREIERLKAENKRLREALQQIADFDGGYDPDAWCVQSKIANEALKHKGQDSCR